jgi:peptide-methionine (R)-S-oxide reductase
MNQINPYLSDEQKKVLFEKGTERPYSGQYVDHAEKGSYSCINCGAMLFHSDAKYDSQTIGLLGWPSFDQAIEGSVEYRDDHSMGMKRVEVVCSNCGVHLGHVFDADDAKTGKHYCINSVCLGFQKSEKEQDGNTRIILGE